MQPQQANTVVGAVVGLVGVGVVAASAPELLAVCAAPVFISGVLAVIDQRTRRIANRHAAVLAFVTLVACGLGVVVDRGSWSSIAGGALLWAAPLFLLAVVAGFGGGDFKFAFSLGALTGWVSLSCSLTGLLLALLFAAVAAVVVGVRQRTSKAQVPLGLPLFAGAVASIAVAANLS